LRNTPLAPKWRLIIERNNWHWNYLAAGQRERLAGLVQIFVAEKHWEGLRGLTVDDEIRVTVAAAACLLLLGFDDDYCFDRARTILISPAAFRDRQPGDDFEPGEEHGGYAIGQAWKGGTIVLSWRDVRRECRRPGAGHNVVVHEFAHHVDSLDGEMGGTPPLVTANLRGNWSRVMEATRAELANDLDSDRPTVLDPYGLTNRAELFAVASEAFFCRPSALRSNAPELYELLSELFRLDPAAWFADEPTGERKPPL
jgi:hypothetical protein